jgi:Zc3h12a-like Ribonuclease NYN domain
MRVGWFSFRAMRTPLTLFIVCAFGMVLAAMTPGLEDFVLIAGLATVASVVLLLLASRRRKPAASDPRRVIVDGSNVMYWVDNSQSIVTLVAVVQHLERLGYRPFVIFDANAGYLLNGSFSNADAFGRMLGLPTKQVIVAPKGTPADPIILANARQSGLPIVTNDRYRDWLDQHPEVRAPGRLIRGGWREGQPWVDMDAFVEPRKAA